MFRVSRKEILRLNRLSFFEINNVSYSLVSSRNHFDCSLFTTTPLFLSYSEGWTFFVSSSTGRLEPLSEPWTSFFPKEFKVLVTSYRCTPFFPHKIKSYLRGVDYLTEQTYSGHSSELNLPSQVPLPVVLSGV